MKKLWNYFETNSTVSTHLETVLKVHPTFCKLLVQRGISDFESAKSFFRYDLSQAHEPLLMKDMSKAVDRLLLAIESKETILIYGDYDVDGTTGVALMYRFLKKSGATLDYYLPDRHKEGYGLSEAGVLYAKKQNASLMISVDCGIKAIENIALANSHQIDVIVCDHHLPFDSLPPAFAILNPLQADCNYPFKGLSGAGVAFKLCTAISNALGMEKEAMDDLMDLLCLSICCDIVPIVDENRIFCEAGLKKINYRPSLAVKALLKQSKRPNPLSVTDVVYGLGPLINAAGRLSHAKEAVQLLLNDDWDSVLKQAQYLAHQNRQRRMLDVASSNEAKHMVKSQDDWASKKAIVLYNPEWHKGILGILAARTAEQFNRPTVILTDSEKGISGSARSVLGFNLYESLEACNDLFDSFGGHHYAAGLSMKKENLEAFKSRFEQKVAETIEKEALEATQIINADINLDDITPEFMKIYRQFAPFGPKNRRPVFATYNAMIQPNPRFMRDKHVQFKLKNIEGNASISVIGFGLADTVRAFEDKVVKMAFTIKEETYRGKTQLKLHVKDLALV